jgi:hypothetical protein
MKRLEQTQDEKVYGFGYRLHPVTKMPIEQAGSSLPDDVQAERVHIPHIRATRGDAVADLMLADLKKYRQAKYADELKWAKVERGEA